MAEEYTDYEYERSNSHKVLKTVLKIVVIALIIFVYGAVMIRSCSRQPERHILYSDKLRELMRDGGTAEIYYQKPYDTINRNDAGTFQFAISDFYYIPETKQLQITVRYNLAVLRDAAETYMLESVPQEDCFSYSLLFDDGYRITSYSYASYVRANYCFRYILFDGVDLDSYTPVMYTAEDAEITASDGKIIAHETDQYGKSILYDTDENGYAKVYDRTYVSLEIYYEDDVNFNKNPISSLMVFNRMYKLELLKDPARYIDFDGKYPIIKVN